MRRWSLLMIPVLALSGCAEQIKLRIVDAETKQPLARARISRSPIPYDSILSEMGDPWKAGETGPSGRMDLPIRSDLYDVLITTTGYQFVKVWAKRVDGNQWVLCEPSNGQETLAQWNTWDILEIPMRK